MLQNGPAVRVIIHLNEDTGSRKDYLHRDVLSFLFVNEVSGATVIRPHAGFGLHHRVHTAGAAGIEGEHIPIRIEFVETRQKVEGLLPHLFEMVSDGIIEAQDTTVLKVGGHPGSALIGGLEG